MGRKLILTRYILKLLFDWYVEENNTQDNDLTVLKTLKLFFLLGTIDTEEENNLISFGFDQYSALPLGPVEMEVYNDFQENLRDVVTREGLIIQNLEYHEIDFTDKELIESLVSKLKLQNKRLISASASYLVNLTHKYSSWIISINKARSEGVNSAPMDIKYIRTEEKFYYL
ncbi:hypothetical protein ACYSNM_12995 [Myroides sp. LJL116]